MLAICVKSQSFLSLPRVHPFLYSYRVIDVHENQVDEYRRFMRDRGMSLKYDLFLSHNNADKNWTQYLANRIEQDASGPPLNIFFDEWDIAPGDDIPLALE